MMMMMMMMMMIKVEKSDESIGQVSHVIFNNY